MEDIGSLMKSCSAAIGVSKASHIESDESCDTHNGKKFGCANVGRLVRSRNKVIVSVLEDFQKFIAKFHKIENHFSKISKNSM